MFGYDECGVTVDTQHKMKTHKESQHPAIRESVSSPEPSPPRKKPVRDVEIKCVGDADDMMIDIDVINKVKEKEEIQ